jgi:DNA-directed RNA polymerase specialized sigma24 family protein
MPFTLELLGNASQEEIARVCACSQRTVRRRLKAARERFIRLVRSDPALASRLGESAGPAKEGASNG